MTTGELVDLFCNAWGEDQTWENRFMGGPHEANFLKTWIVPKSRGVWLESEMACGRSLFGYRGVGKSLG